MLTFKTIISLGLKKVMCPSALSASSTSRHTSTRHPVTAPRMLILRRPGHANTHVYMRACMWYNKGRDMRGGWSVSRCGATFLAVTRRQATVKRSTYSTDLRCDCFGEGHTAPVSPCKGEGNTHSPHKNNTVVLINKIRVTTATQLGVHVEEDEDRTSKIG